MMRVVVLAWQAGAVIGIAASMLGVCTRTIRRWDTAGLIPCTRTRGGHRRVSLAVIEALSGRPGEKENEHVSSSPAVYCRVSLHEQKANACESLQHPPGYTPRGPGARYRPLACHATTNPNSEETGQVT